MGRRAAVDALGEVAFAAELLADAGPDETSAMPIDVDAKAVSGLAWAYRSAPKDGGADAILSLPGMSPALYAVVDDALHDREPALLAQLKTLLPPGLFGLRQVKGLGPKKIKKLWGDLGIESLGELEYACRENRLIDLDGFGKKTQASVLEQLTALQAQQGQVRRDTAMSMIAEVMKSVVAAGGEAFIAGGLRRGAELIDDVVVVCTAAPGVEIPAGVRVVVTPAKSLGVNLIVATGSAAHVAALQARAAGQGRQFEDIEGEEAAVYAALGLLVTPPELREQGTLIERGQPAPQLVRREDLQGALHNHTTASDGTDTPEVMLAAAKAAGLRWLGISDHSKAAAYAHGLDEVRLAAQRQALSALAVDGVEVLTGVETDIMRDGALDIDDEALLALDVVVASMHQRYGLKGPPMTARLLAAAAHPLVDVVGHPTGRLLLSRPEADFDVSALLQVCADVGCAVELNANPARLDFGARWLAEARDRGVLVSIAADAHAADELENLDHGIAVARRAGLRPEDVLNTRSAAEVRAWVQARRRRRRETPTMTGGAS